MAFTSAFEKPHAPGLSGSRRIILTATDICPRHVARYTYPSPPAARNVSSASSAGSIRHAS